MTKPRSRPKSWPAPRASPLSLQHDSDDSFSDGVSELSSSENEDPHTMRAFPDIVKGKGKEETGKLGQKILPAEILETILYAVDPDTFASLILVDHAWREASQTPHLYAHQLSRCQSYAINNPVADAGPFTDDSLSELKRKFAQEVKRNLFEAFLQPKRTIISLVSTTTSSSAAFPAGEAFDFAFSPNGHWTLALSSSRIYVLDTASPGVSVQRELKVPRRPIGAFIHDDGSTLVVLSSRHITIYDISNLKSKLKRSIPLENTPHAMAVSRKGEVLAVAHVGGVELRSLAPNAGDVDRRSVRCDRVDTLAFSSDATMLLGTTRNSQNPYTVVLTTPYYMDDNQDMPPSESIGLMWTTQIIIPHSSRDCSHSALLSNRSDGDATWTFTFDRAFESFRAVRTDDLRNGTTYFTGPKRRRRSQSRNIKYKLTPSTLPAPSQNGELVATGFFGKDIWIYGVPQGLDMPVVPQFEEPNSTASQPSTPVSGPRTPTRSLSRGDASERRRLPRWEVLLDKYRNVFAKGRRVAEIEGITGLSWVEQEGYDGSASLKERLIVAAPGGVAAEAEPEHDGFATVDGGRLIVLDFDRRQEDGKVEQVTFEVGTEDPDVLEEVIMDIDTEVELARRRTRRDTRPVSTVVDALAPPTTTDVPPLPPTANALANMRAQQAAQQAIQPSHTTVTTLAPVTDAVPQAESPGLTVEEASATFDGPYSHTNPRSRTSLYRSATAVAGHRERNPPRIVQNAAVEYRRPGTRGELPHESDADDWVPPPPPYQPKADIPLPEHLQRTLLPKPAEPAPRMRKTLRRPQRSTTMYESPSPRRVSAPPGRQPSDLQYSRPQTTVSARSVSESLDRLSGPANVSPLSTDFSGGDDRSEPSNASRSTSLSSRRRPVSAYVGRVANSLRRKSHPRLPTDPSANPGNAPPVPPLPLSSTSLPPSPTPASGPSSPANTVQRSNHDDIPNIPSLPSAEQLANLSNRSRQPPPQATRRPIPPSLNTTGERIPAPPRGALGAAGSPSAALVHSSPTDSPRTRSPRTPSPSRRQNPRQVSPLANPNAVRSTPSLLRPAAKRLDTIESIGSNASVSRSRSRGDRRSQSVGPALRLDRVGTAGAGAAGKEREGKRRLFGLRKDKEKGKAGPGEMGGEKEKEGRCRVM